MGIDSYHFIYDLVTRSYHNYVKGQATLQQTANCGTVYCLFCIIYMLF